MAELLAGVDIGDMHFHDGSLHSPDSILERNARMSVGSGIENYSVPVKSHLMYLVDELSLHVRLIVAKVNVGITLHEFVVVFRKTS